MGKTTKKILWLLAIIVVLIVLASSVFFLPNDYNVPLKNYHEADSTFSIMTFNIDTGDTLRFTQEKQDKLVALIRQYQPSILCLQELSFDNHERIRPQLESIYGKYDTILSAADNKWRFLFYSRYPIRNFKRYEGIGKLDTSGFDDQLKQYSNTISQQLPMMSAEFEIKPGYWMTVFSGQLRSSAYSTARRSMDKNQNWIYGIPLYRKNYQEGKRIRDYEAKSIRKYIDDELSQDNPVLVAGDLNDWSGSDCLNILQGSGDKELKDTWSEKGNGWGFTYFGWHLRLRLDHILYSTRLKLKQVNVIDTDISDHRPLVAVFEIN